MATPLVLNTRPAEQAAELTRALRRRGLAVLEAPTVEVQAIPPQNLSEVLSRLRHGHFTWTVVPSANAARFLVDALESAGATPAALSRTRVLCGAATAALLARRGVLAERTLERFSAAEALETLRSEPLEGQAVLLPRAREGRDELAEGLRDRGVDVGELVLYETRSTAAETLRPAAERLLARGVAAAAFTSPSCARGFLDSLRALGVDPPVALDGVALVVIGETTAAELRAAGLPEPTIAERTSVESLAEAAAAIVGRASVPPAGAGVQSA